MNDETKESGQKSGSKAYSYPKQERDFWIFSETGRPWFCMKSRKRGMDFESITGSKIEISGKVPPHHIRYIYELRESKKQMAHATYWSITFLAFGSLAICCFGFSKWLLENSSPSKLPKYPLLNYDRWYIWTKNDSTWRQKRRVILPGHY